jgi:hypothetical protein
LPGETNKYSVVGKPLLPFDTVFYENDWHVSTPVVSLQFARNSLNLEHPKQRTQLTHSLLFSNICCVGGVFETTISISRFEHHTHYMSWIAPTRVVMPSCKKGFVTLLVIVCHIPVPLFN